MCTGNLRSGTQQLFLAVKNKNRKNLKNSLSYYSIILFFTIGAASGAMLTKIINEKSVLISAAVLAIPFILMFKPSVIISDE